MSIQRHMPYARGRCRRHALFAERCRRQALSAERCRCRYSRTYATACALRGSRLVSPHLFEDSALRDDFSSACCTERERDTHTQARSGVRAERRLQQRALQQQSAQQRCQCLLTHICDTCSSRGSIYRPPQGTRLSCRCMLLPQHTA